MAFSSRPASWLRNLLHLSRVERELDDELRSYLDLLVAEKIRMGMAPERALRAAALELGGIERIKDEVRDVRTGAWLQGLGRDLRYAGRALRKRPAFTAIAALTLALGIGGTGSIASLEFALFEAGLPFPGADRLGHGHQTRPRLGEYTQPSHAAHA